MTEKEKAPQGCFKSKKICFELDTIGNHDESQFNNRTTFDIFIQDDKKLYIISIPKGLSKYITPSSFYKIFIQE